MKTASNPFFSPLPKQNWLGRRPPSFNEETLPSVHDFERCDDDEGTSHDNDELGFVDTPPLHIMIDSSKVNRTA